MLPAEPPAVVIVAAPGVAATSVAFGSLAPAPSLPAVPVAAAVPLSAAAEVSSVALLLPGCWSRRAGARAELTPSKCRTVRNARCTTAGMMPGSTSSARELDSVLGPCCRRRAGGLGPVEPSAVLSLPPPPLVAVPAESPPPPAAAVPSTEAVPAPPPPVPSALSAPAVASAAAAPSEAADADTCPGAAGGAAAVAAPASSLNFGVTPGGVSQRIRWLSVSATTRRSVPAAVAHAAMPHGFQRPSGALAPMRISAVT